MEDMLGRYGRHLDTVLKSRHARCMYMQRVRVPGGRATRTGSQCRRAARDMQALHIGTGLSLNSTITQPIAAVRHYWSMVAERRWANDVKVDDFTLRPEIESECTELEEWLRTRHALAKETVHDHVGTVGRFLYREFDGRPFYRGGVGAGDLASHLSGAMSSHSEATRRRVATDVRSYAAFLRSAGHPDLEEGLRTLATKGAAVRRPLPSAMSDCDYTALLTVPDPSTPRGLRDIATIRCMGDLGLRRSDVARIDLD